MARSNTIKTLSWKVIWIAALALAGCRPSPPPVERDVESVGDRCTRESAPPATTELTLLCLGDERLGTVAAREWQADTGIEVTVHHQSWQSFNTEPVVAQPDVILAADWQLGSLVDLGMAASLPDSWLKSPPWRPDDLLHKPRRELVVWQDEIRGASFGSPYLVLAYRADIFRAADVAPPRSWREYATLLDQLTFHLKSTGSETIPVIEPLAGEWGAGVFLAHAAAYVRHRSQVTALFSVGDMEAQIASPPFVRALEELSAASKHGKADQWLDSTPESALAALRHGDTLIAWTWPHVAWPDDLEHETAGGLPEIEFAAIPGSHEYYYFRGGQWQSREGEQTEQVPLLGVCGQIGVVHPESRHRHASFQMLSWLTGPDRGLAISGRSPNTAPYRQTHLDKINPWLGRLGTGASATSYAKQLKQLDEASFWLTYPRFRHADRYLDLLSKGVHATVRGEQTPGEALDQVARQWNELTDQLGRDRQRRSYLQSIGLGAMAE